jgi:hypothetical protein
MMFLELTLKPSGLTEIVHGVEVALRACDGIQWDLKILMYLGFLGDMSPTRLIFGIYPKSQASVQRVGMMSLTLSGANLLRDCVAGSPPYGLDMAMGFACMTPVRHTEQAGYYIEMEEK